MATVINNPGNGPAPVDDRGTGTGMIIGIIVVIVVILLLLFFGWPALRRGGASTTTPSSAPSGGTTIQVPDKLNVNVNKGQ